MFETAPVVNRNGVDLQFVPFKFGKLSPLANQQFWGPSVGSTAEEHQKFITFYGESDFWENVQTDVRRDFADLWADHLEKHDGVIVPDDLMQEWKEFTAGRQSLAKVKEEIELLGEQQTEIATNPALELNEAGEPITELAVKLLQEMRRIGMAIRPLKEKRAKIEAEYQRRADKRAATKAAKQNA